MMAMQRVQPEIKKLQAKYKNDRQKLNEETMKFYQENKINPLAGCLPLLLQMPIFIALFSVLREPVEVHPEELDALHGPLHNLGAEPDGTWTKCGPTHVRATILGSRMSRRRTPRHQLHFLGLDLQESADQVSGGFLECPAVLRPRRTGDHQLRHVDPPGAEAHARCQQANGHGHEDPAAVLRAHLDQLPVRPGPVLLREQLWRLGQQERDLQPPRPRSSTVGARNRPWTSKSTERAATPKPGRCARKRSRPSARPPRGRRSDAGDGAAAPVSGALPGDDEKPRGCAASSSCRRRRKSTGGNGAERRPSASGHDRAHPRRTSASAQNRRRSNKKRKR